MPQINTAQKLSKPKRKPLKHPSKGSAVEYAFRELRDRILDLRLTPGAILDEASICSEIGLSRTPIREALTQLSSYGLVEITPNRGARVAPVELAEAPEILETLELFQRAINRWAALRRSEEDLEAINKARQNFEDAVARGNVKIMGRANYDFHAAISQSCGNRSLTEAADRVELKSARLVNIAYNSVRSKGDMENYHQLVIEHHAKIQEAVRNHDGAAADNLAHQHTTLFRNRLLSFVGHSQAQCVVILPPETA